MHVEYSVLEYWLSKPSHLFATHPDWCPHHGHQIFLSFFGLIPAFGSHHGVGMLIRKITSWVQSIYMYKHVPRLGFVHIFEYLVPV